MRSRLSCAFQLELRWPIAMHGAPDDRQPHNFRQPVTLPLVERVAAVVPARHLSGLGGGGIGIFDGPKVPSNICIDWQS